MRRRHGPRVMGVVTATAAPFVLAAARPGIALAHTGEDVPLSHIILEVGQWSLGAAGVVAVLVGLLWVRARMTGRRG